MTSGSKPALNASLTVLLSSSDRAISDENDGAHDCPKESVIRSRKSEIRTIDNRLCLLS
jgi:hypothetical protein